MKSRHIVFLCVGWMLAVISSYSQQAETIKSRLEGTPEDSNRVNLMIELAESYYFNKPDTCLIIAKQALQLARKLNYSAGEVSALNKAGEAYRFTGDYPKALDMQFKALDINKKRDDESGEARSLGFIGLVYIELKEYRQGLNYLYQANELYNRLSLPVLHTFNLSNIGSGYEGLNILDSALFFQNQARVESVAFAHGNLKSLILRRLGNVYARLNNYEKALQYYFVGLQNTFSIGDQVNLSPIQIGIAEVYLTTNKVDSGLYYVRLAFANAQNASQRSQILEASNLLVKLFRMKGQADSVIQYQDIAIAMKDSLYGPSKFRQLQLLTLREQQQQQEILAERERDKNKTRFIALGVMLGFFLIIAILLYWNNRQKQKVNHVLEQQKNEIQETLSILKSTQDQLIQREKMASLGELTAGIAHEIQNPLNFVNNFSEVNTELIDELDEAASHEPREVSYEAAIRKNIKENSEKIKHHGKRADAIVKNMLQHSRGAVGVNKKEPTDINKLAEEYLRLSFAGYQAKNTGFECELNIELDKTLLMINVIPQDIGRALLNLFNNAFWACAERSLGAVNERSEQIINSMNENRNTLNEKNEKDKYQTESQVLGSPNPTIGGLGGRGKSTESNTSYHPSVTLTTKNLKDKIEISIKDNGPGIPQNIIDKIFQPFFTTKPAGEGTGLGLSLAYDIVKAHGGDIKVISNYCPPESKLKESAHEDSFTEFIIQLPAQ